MPPPTEIQHGTVTLRALPDWPSFWAGDDGFIWHDTKRGGLRRLRHMQPKHGYATVTLYHDRNRYWRVKPNGKRHYVMKPSPHYVHVLVASVWLAARPGPEYTIDHENENKMDNRPANLRWLVGAMNTAEYHRNNPGALAGQNNGNARLTDEKARQILGLRGTVTLRMAADSFGVSRCTVWRIWNGRGWKHLTRTEAAARQS